MCGVTPGRPKGGSIPDGGAADGKSEGNREERDPPGQTAGENSRGILRSQEGGDATALSQILNPGGFT